MTYFRRHFGLRWPRPTPSPADLGLDRQNLLLIGLLLLIYLLVGSIDYATAQDQARQAAEARADLNRAALLACLNGGAPGLYVEQPDGSRQYLVCGDTFEVSDKNVGSAS